MEDEGEVTGWNVAVKVPKPLQLKALTLIIGCLLFSIELIGSGSEWRQKTHKFLYFHIVQLFTR